jgi:hypothetical protein
MKKTGGGLNAGIKNKGLQAIQAVNYQNIAGGLADEMMSFIRPSEPRKCVVRRSRWSSSTSTALSYSNAT